MRRSRRGRRDDPNERRLPFADRVDAVRHDLAMEVQANPAPAGRERGHLAGAVDQGGELHGHRVPARWRTG
jgi:hypothetical protein